MPHPTCLGLATMSGSSLVGSDMQHARPMLLRSGRSKCMDLTIMSNPSKLGLAALPNPGALGLAAMSDPRLGVASNMVARPKAFRPGNLYQIQVNNKQREDNGAL